MSTNVMLITVIRLILFWAILTFHFWIWRVTGCEWRLTVYTSYFTFTFYVTFILFYVIFIQVRPSSWLCYRLRSGMAPVLLQGEDQEGGHGPDVCLGAEVLFVSLVFHDRFEQKCYLCLLVFHDRLQVPTMSIATVYYISRVCDWLWILW